MQQRITILDEEFPFPLNSGKRIRTYHLLRHLSQHFRITYIAHHDPEVENASQALEAMNSIFIQPVPIYRKVQLQKGVRFYWRLAKNLLGPLPYSVTSHTSEAMRKAILEHHKRVHPDLWHCEWTPYANVMRNYHFPTVVMAHNVESQIWQRYSEREPNRFKKWYCARQWQKWLRFESWVCERADQVIAVSNPDALLFQNRFQAQKVSVVENGVDLDFFQLNSSTIREPFQLLFLGSLDWRPNLDAVIWFLDHVFPAIRTKEPRATFAIVGRKPPSWLFEKVTTISGVQIHADVADVRPYLWKSSMLVVPLRIGGGSRLKILEALATELPVVSSTIGAEGLDLIPNQHLVIADTIQEWIDEILEGFQAPGTRLALAKQGRGIVQSQYDWKILAQKLEQCWRETIEMSQR